MCFVDFETGVVFEGFLLRPIWPQWVFGFWGCLDSDI